MPTVSLEVVFGGAAVVFAEIFTGGGGAFTGGGVLTLGGVLTFGGALVFGGALTFGGAFTLGAETLGALTALRRSRAGDSSSSSSSYEMGSVRRKERIRKKER